jgi:tetratricopeptide (TPR) repeat protein
MNLGLNYIGNNVPDQSIQFFNEADEKDSSGLSKLFLGYISCEMEDWKTAREYFQAGLRQNPSFNIQLELSRLNQTIANAEKIPSRSPTLAATLSLILPGSGQLYSNHTFDALQAFSFVAMLSYVSYITYKYDEKFSSNRMLTGVSLSITALFYIANIYGAYQTAKYFNIRQKDIFLQDMRERIMNFDF